jgi:dephospho-CoA kinase
VSRLVGLTGGIGCGKSVVASMLAELGARVIDADALAREAVQPGSPGLDAIVRRFGSEVLLPDGTLDRKRLGTRVFSDASARADLNAIVHPEVSRLALERMAALSSEGAPVIVYDVPLLYENGLERMLPEVIVVHAPPAAQRARIAARDRLPEDEIERRIAAQMPLEEKMAKAQHLIDNGGSLEATRAQVEALWTKLLGGTTS